MRKRKINPSLEVAVSSRDISLDLGANVVSDPREVAAIVPQPTASPADTKVPASGRPASEAGVATREKLSPP